MNSKYIFSSLLRISDLEKKAFELKKLEKIKWKTGDYVVGKITNPGNDEMKIELTNGRMRSFMKEDMKETLKKERIISVIKIIPKLLKFLKSLWKKEQI